MMTCKETVLTLIKRIFVVLLIVSGICGAVLFLYAFVMSGFSIFERKDYETNLYTEIFGVLLSVFISVVIVGGWTEWRARVRLKRRLRREAGSRSNDIALSAVEWLREESWLIGKNSLLKNAKLDEANLTRAELSRANLEKATLNGARLNEAGLYRANLKGASLVSARLQPAILISACLEGANLHNAKLQGAHLSGANLRGAYMMWAELDGAHLKFEDLIDPRYTATSNIPPAILPDGNNWTEDTDMGKFTYENHIDFKETLKKINSIREKLGYDVLPLFRTPSCSLPPPPSMD